MFTEINPSSGSIKFIPMLRFSIYHHCAFGYNPDSKKVEFNSNPYGEDRLKEISNFTISENGFSFLKENNKRVTTYHDKTPFENQITKELHYLINKFCFVKGYYTGLDLGWSANELLSLRFISWEKGYSSDFLSLGRSDGKLYTGSTPLYDKIEVFSISFKPDEIYLKTSKGDIQYKYNLNPHLHRIVKYCFCNQFSQFLSE